MSHESWQPINLLQILESKTWRGYSRLSGLFPDDFHLLRPLFAVSVFSLQPDHQTLMIIRMATEWLPGCVLEAVESLEVGPLQKNFLTSTLAMSLQNGQNAAACIQSVLSNGLRASWWNPSFSRESVEYHQWWFTTNTLHEINITMNYQVHHRRAVWQAVALQIRKTPNAIFDKSLDETLAESFSVDKHLGKAAPQRN